ncbi:MAG: hypothetical protein J6Q53_05940 [Oscillospiraceae bacterium]|nr:hypothetical protein [Oscillospiraceae bacterium]
MFEDKRKALEALEAELLKEEAAEQEDRLFPDEDALLDDPADIGEYPPEAHSNYQTRLHAYNTDHADTDLDDYSEQVRRPRRDTGTLTLIAIALCLLAGILAVLVYWFIRF